MLASFPAGTIYVHLFTVQAAWSTLLSFHFTLWSLSLAFYWNTRIPCTTRLFKWFSLEHSLCVWMLLSVQAQDWVLQTWADSPTQFRNPRYLACTSGSGGFWVPVTLVRARGDTTEQPAAAVACWGMGSSLSTKHLELCSSEGPGSHLSRNAKRTKADQTW